MAGHVEKLIVIIKVPRERFFYFSCRGRVVSFASLVGTLRFFLTGKVASAQRPTYHLLLPLPYGGGGQESGHDEWCPVRLLS